MIKSELYKKDSFINGNILYLFNTEITEYDMKEAGFSLIQEFKLIPENKINKLKEYGKEKRKIEIGKLQRDDSILRENMKIAFKKARYMFFDENDIEDNDIISIKKDAVITKKLCMNKEFGKYINFRLKNYYTSYIRLIKNIELYYNPEKLDIKGIGEKNIPLHEDYIINFFKSYFNKMETSDNKTVIEFTRRFIDKYKNKELPVGYYRNFNVKSDFSLLENEDNEQHMVLWEEDKSNIDISYNFYNILLKLIKIPL